MFGEMPNRFAVAIAAMSAFSIAAIATLINAPLSALLVRWGESGGSGSVVYALAVIFATAAFGLFAQFALPVLCAVAVYKRFSKKKSADEISEA